MSAAAVRRVVSRLAPTELGRASTDAELVLAAAGDAREAAFTLLVERYGPMVLGVCRGGLGDAHDAEDAFQAVFIVLARRLGTISPPGVVGGWLYGVAVRTARKAKVAAARRRRREMAVAAQTSAQCTDGSDLERAELRSAIDAELAALPEMQRAAVVLCDLHEKTRAEVAAELNSPEGTVASWLARGRKALADRLARRGLALPAAALATATVPSTVSAELAAAALTAAAGRASPAAQALAEGVLKTMSTTAKFATVLTAAGLVLAATAVIWAADPPKAEPPAPKVVAAPVPVPADGKGFLDHGRTVHVTEFSPDGKRFLSVGGGAVTVWDTVTRKKLFTAEAEFARFSRERLRVDGTPLLFVFHGKEFRHLHAVTGKLENDRPRWWDGDELLKKPAGGGRWARPTNDGLQRAEFDGARFSCHFCVGAGNLVLGGQEAHDPKGKKRIPAYGRGGEFDETGRLAGIHAATTGYKQVACLSIWSGTDLVGTISRPGRGVQAFAWSPDGSEIAVAYSDGVRVYSTDPKSGGTPEKGADDQGPFKRLRTLDIAGATALAWAKNGNSLAVAARTEKDGMASVAVAVFDAGTGKERSRIDDFPANQPIVSLAFSPSGKRLLCGAGYFPGDETGDARTAKDAPALRLLNVEAPPWCEPGAALNDHKSHVNGVAVAPDGKSFAAATEAGVTVWDAATQKVLWAHKTRGPAHAVAYSGNGYLAFAGATESVVLDAKTGKAVPLNDLGKPTTLPGGGALAFDQLSARLAVGDGYATRVRYLPPMAGEVSLEGPPAPKDEAGKRPAGLAWSKDGKRLAVIGHEEKGKWPVVIWGAGSEAPTVRLAGHEARVVAVAWSADGALIASADKDGVVILWDAATGKPVWRKNLDADNLDNPATALAISPVDNAVAVAGVLGSGGLVSEAVVLFAAKDGKVIQALKRESKFPLTSVAWAPDGSFLVTGSGSSHPSDKEGAGEVVVWDRKR
jgi:RNA polymerase sigma factor (sigma-70 family)